MTEKPPPDDENLERWKAKLEFECGICSQGDGSVVDSDVKDLVAYIPPMKKLQRQLRKNDNYPTKTRFRFPAYYKGWIKRDELFKALCRSSLESGDARLIIRDSIQPNSSRSTKERVASISITCDHGTRYETKAGKDSNVRCPFGFTVFLASDDYWYLSVSSTTKDLTSHVGHAPLSRGRANEYASKLSERPNPPADSARKRLADEDAVTSLFEDCWEMASDDPALRKRMRSGLKGIKADLLAEKTRLEQNQS